MEKFFEYINDTKIVLQNYIIILDSINFYGTQPDLYSNLSGDIIGLDKLLNIQMAKDTPTILHNYNIITKTIYSLKEHSAHIDILMSQGDELAKIFIQSTVTEKVVEKYNSTFNNLQKQINQLINHFTYSEIIEDFIGNIKLNNKKDIKNFYKICYDILTNEKNQHFLGIYEALLDRYYATPLKKDVYHELLTTTEKLKQNILGDKIKKRPKKINPVQDIVQKYSLSPITDAMTLDELAAWFKVSIKLDYKNLINDLSKALSKDIILIVKKTETPIDYNIWLISDRSYIQKKALYISRMEGINRRTIEKSKIIRSCEAKDDLKSGIFFTNNYDTYVVLESVDGHHIKVMSIWDKHLKKADIPHNWLYNLTTGECPASKIENYNKILNDAILEKIEDRKETETDISNIPFYRIINNIINKLMGKLREKKFDIRYIKSQKFTGEIIRGISEEIYSIFIQKNIDHETSDLILRELNTSYLYDLEYISSNIRDYLIEQLKMAKLKNLKSAREKIRAIQKTLETVMKKYINARSGIFLIASKKLSILIK